MAARNSHLGPDCLEQHVFGHELARLGHQAAEDRKGFWGQWDRLVATPQPFITPIEPERPKDETLRLLHSSPRVSQALHTGPTQYDF